MTNKNCMMGMQKYVLFREIPNPENWIGPSRRKHGSRSGLLMQQQIHPHQTILVLRFREKRDRREARLRTLDEGSRSNVFHKTSKETLGICVEAQNWLRNRRPSSQSNGEVTIFKWHPNRKVDLQNIPSFGQEGLYFVYRSTKIGKIKILPRFVLTNFLAMVRNTRLSRIYISRHKKLHKCA